MTENPKFIQALKDGKAPLEYLVTSVWPGDALVHKHGADKYGANNWRKDKIKANTYKAAILRHLKAWAEGEDLDPESGYNHLYHIRACCAIVLDSEKHGTLIDDREQAVSKAVKFDEAAPHTPAMAEMIDLERSTDVTFGPWDVVFTEYADDGLVNAVHSRGPYESAEAAADYAQRNPERLAGVASVHKSQHTTRK